MKSHAYSYTFQTTSKGHYMFVNVYADSMCAWYSQTTACVAPERPPLPLFRVQPFSRTTNMRSSREMTRMCSWPLTSMALAQLLTRVPRFGSESTRSRMCITVCVKMTQRVLLSLKLPFANKASIADVDSSLSRLYSLLSSFSTLLTATFY